MFRDILTLKRVRLAGVEEWSCGGKGLFFVFTRSGSGEFYLGSIHRKIFPRDLLVLSGKSGIRVRPAHGGEVTFAFFRASLEVIFQLASPLEICLLLGGTAQFEHGQLYPARTPIASECNRLLQDVPPPGLQHRSRLLKIVGAILSFELKNHPVQAIEKRFANAFQTLSVHDIVELSVEELSCRFHCSRRHLNRLFRQGWGFSVANLKSRMRLLRAAALLRNPEFKIIDVAGECGFHTLSWFNARFKRQFGMSPGQWRKTARQVMEEGCLGVTGCSSCRFDTAGLCPWDPVRDASSSRKLPLLNAVRSRQ